MSMGEKQKEAVDTENGAEKETIRKKMIFVQYRGNVTDDYCRSLKKCNAPCNPIRTLRKLKTLLPSLKAPIEKIIRSGVVYKINCP